MPGAVLYLDMDCFFAACHQQGNPFLRNKPIAVIGNFRGGLARRAVIAAASKEAKKFGVTNGMPPFKAKELCPGIIFVAAESARYEYISQEVFKIMAEYSDNLKIFSIDEAAIHINNESDNSDGNDIYNKAKKAALNIKEKIKDKLGEYLTCSIGISYNYILAKLASDLSKPNGLKIITKAEAPEILKTLAIDKIAGIGEKTKEKLFFSGIKNFSALQKASESFLKSRLGIFGVNLKKISLGEDHPYYQCQSKIKSIGHSETFFKDTLDKKTLDQYLLKLSEKVSFRLRRKNLEGSVICLTVRFNNFLSFTRQQKLNFFTFDGYEIFKEALKILYNFNLYLPVRLLGLSVFNLRSAVQASLFQKNERRKIFLKSIDKIKTRYGFQKIFPLATKNIALKSDK